MRSVSELSGFYLLSDRLLRLMYMELTMVASSCMDSFRSGWPVHIRATSLFGSFPLNSR